MGLHRLTRSALIGCLTAAAVSAQSWISVGVKGGVPLNDPFADRTYNFVIATIPSPFGPPGIASQTSTFSTGSRGLVLGPTLEVQLPFGLAAEFDALYRPMIANVQSTTFLPLGFAMNEPALPIKVDVWEFPLLAKYRLPVRSLKPYLEAGPSFRASNAQHISAKGVSAGVGVETRVGRFRIAPEIRYTHWGSDGNYTTFYHPTSYPNQLELLAGLATAPAASGYSLGGKEPLRTISVGVKAGLPFMSAFLRDEFGKVSYPSIRCGNFSGTPCTDITGTLEMYWASRNYLLGPSVEIHLPLNLSVEGDALYHPLSLALFPDPSLLQSPSIKPFNSWEFPILGKYRFPAPFARPYLEAGPTFRTASLPYGRYLAKAGATAGLGIEALLWRIRIAPEVRFVHWGHDALDAGPFYSSKRNQAQFLLGLSY